MNRLHLPLLLSLVALLGFSVEARSAYQWCSSDPLISLDGALVDITLSMPLEYVPLVDGSTRIEVRTPKGTARQLVFNDPGFNLKGNTVVFQDGAGAAEDGMIPTDIKVVVPVDESRLADGETVPVQLAVTAADGQRVVSEGTYKRTEVSLTVTGH